jgi:hypothetical protein
MKFRLALCSVLAAVAVSAAVSFAVALPPACPPGFHEGGGNVACISDSTHMAASGTGMIPDAAMLQKDPRLRLRVGIGLLGALTGTCLLVVGFGARTRPGDEFSDAVSAAP